VAIDVGSRIRDYEIIARLKAGGMATLFLARRVGAAGFSRHVAIKVVHPHLAEDQGFIRMFIDEALLSARIQHPNVVHVEELGEDHGTYFLAMEYVHGSALSTLLGSLAKLERRLAPDLAVWIAMRLADGLHAAHELRSDTGEPLGVVHRDVSPQNVILSMTGHVKLIDFGIAKAASSSGKKTETGSLKGKLRYMAPEQAYGQNVDRRTDIYALGIVLWEMLTYRKAFSAKTDAELIRLVLQPKLPPPSRLNPAVASELDGVALTALAPDPEERFQTALAFRNALYGAMPAAQRVNEEEIASLLRDVLAEELQKDAHTLPPKVVVVQPRAVGASSVEEQLTQVVPSLEPDDDDAERPPTPSAPAPRERHVTGSQRTAFGIGLTAPTPSEVRPLPGRPIAITPSPSPSFAPPAASGPIAATRIVHPDVPIGISPGSGTPVRVPPSAMPGFGAPPPTVPHAPAASFTPANAIPRPAIPAAAAAKSLAPPTSAARPGGNVARGCAIAIGVVLTIGLGVTLGWLALHGATHAMTP
jgi:serine/threonine-protein kinase